jgi:hypothetical protein
MTMTNALDSKRCAQAFAKIEHHVFSTNHIVQSVTELKQKGLARLLLNVPNLTLTLDGQCPA